MAERRDQQGTGRHPHKDTQEPWPHTKEQGRQEQHGSHGRSQGSSVGGSHADTRERNEDADLKSREYKGEDGEIHHHTRTYMEQHRGEARGGEHEGGGRQESKSQQGRGSQTRTKGK